jgi:hypothetical protein
MQKPLHRVLFALLLPLFLLAGTLFPQKNRTQTGAYLEYGTDSSERAFFRPRLYFNIPHRFADFFVDAEFLHRMNSRLQGEVDFWIKLGGKKQMSSLFSLEAGLNHFCRHKTLRDYPRILDINELVGKCWFQLPILDLGIGGGTYLGTSNHFTGLVTADLRWNQIFETEFSAHSQLKWVDLNQLFYEFELAFALKPGMDFFARTAKHYEYPKTIYLGMRLHSEGDMGTPLEYFRFRGSIISADEAYKVKALEEFKLSLYETEKRRLLLSLEADVPLKSGEAFLSTFHPDDVSYRVQMDYALKLRSRMAAYVYGLYDLLMPADRADSFSSSLGMGVGIRNQSYFDRLDQAFRFDFSVGQNFKNTFDMRVRLGVNTLGPSARFGSNFRIDFDPDATHALLEVFAEFGNQVRFRPFLAYEHVDLFHRPDSSLNRFLVGIELLGWSKKKTSNPRPSSPNSSPALT